MITRVQTKLSDSIVAWLFFGTNPFRESLKFKLDFRESISPNKAGGSLLFREMIDDDRM